MLPKLKSLLGFWYRGVIGLVQDQLQPLQPLDSKLVKTEIGKSVENRSLWAYRLPNASTDQPAILYLGATHGNEVGTTKLVHRIANWAAEKFATSKYQPNLHFIPCLNPDGYLQALVNPSYLSGGRTGRFNSRGVDLNRNFPTSNFTPTAHWSRGKNYSENVTVNAGPKPLSEPESQALISYIQQHRITVIFSYHSVGADIVCSQDELANQITAEYCQLAGFKQQSERGWQKLNQTGTFKTWCDENQVSLIEVENSSRWGDDWTQQYNAVEASLQKILDT